MILCKLLKVGVDKTAQLAQKFVASGVWAFFHLFARTAAPRSASFPVRRSGIGGTGRRTFRHFFHPFVEFYETFRR